MIPPKAPKPPPSPVTLTKVLLAEGDTPAHFVEALLQQLGLGKTIEVRNFGGIKDLKLALAALAATQEFRQVVSLGIVRDAENDARAARQSVNDAVAAANIGRHVHVAEFIVPDNAAPGILETLCINAVRQHPSLANEMHCVEAFFSCLEQRGIRFPDPVRQAKNVAQAFLATRPEAQMFPGIAAYRGYWPWDSPAFEPLKQFLRTL